MKEMDIFQTVIRSAVIAMIVFHNVTAFPEGRIVSQGENVLEVYQLDISSGTERDFTEINRGLCPPSLCVSQDERPTGTGGSVFFQGDIVLDNKLSKIIYSEKHTARHRRALIQDRKRLWDNGVVFYEMNENISENAEHILLRAMKHIEGKTCITFKERKRPDLDFILFVSEDGCWSKIGRVGGKQVISIGVGCENLGTASHEILHALGIWHEQSRPDRDSYINVWYDNVIDQYQKDFDMVSDDLTTSLQHAYDYQSLMHYSRFAFSRNGQPTIQVTGLGEAHGLSIGQRAGLSNMDIAQLREMYGCNKRHSDSLNVCREGWIKHQKSCYLFMTQPSVQFTEGNSVCQSKGAHLLIINSKGEHKFITKLSNEKFHNIKIWRTAGKKVNDRMVWYINETVFQTMSDFTDWSSGHPGQLTSVILVRNETTLEFQWQGEWADSGDNGEDFRHPFICETLATRQCEESQYPDLRDYRGPLDYTQEGLTCQKWTESYPQNHTLVNYSRSWAASQERSSVDGLGDHNMCRNPDGLRRSRPWCYTTKVNRVWSYCDIRSCHNEVVGVVSTEIPVENVDTSSPATSMSPLTAKEVTEGTTFPATPAMPIATIPLMHHPIKKPPQKKKRPKKVL
ncbi:Zinc metalloproteinase nas-6, partial [Biomphalaria pfeifferi]